jgi:hypothetical protein
MLQLNSTITFLDMSKSDLSDDSCVTSLSSALIQNSTILTLLLRECYIQTDGAIALSKMLRSNATMTKLDLDSIDSKSSGFVAIAEALQCNITLKEICITLEPESWVTDDHSATAHAFAALVAHNSSITYLKIAGFGNFFSEGSAIEMINAMKFNCSITELCLDFCFESSDASAIVDMIATNSRIKSLSMADNEFGDDVMLKISVALKSNTSITELFAFGNCIGDISALSFCDTVKCNSRLKFIAFFAQGELPRLKSSTVRVLKKVMMQYPQIVEWDGFDID